MNARLRVSGRGPQLTPRQKLQVIFIIQEALSNVRKHSHAENVDIRIENDADLKVTITTTASASMMRSSPSERASTWASRSWPSAHPASAPSSTSSASRPQAVPESCSSSPRRPDTSSNSSERAAGGQPGNPAGSPSRHLQGIRWKRQQDRGA